MGDTAHPSFVRKPGRVLSVERVLAATEYEVTANRVGLQAPNRAHGLRSYFTAHGIRVHDRTAPDGSALLSLELARWGRGENLEPVSAGVVTSSGPRVEIRRDGILEWYVNRSEGLEQGFTLATRPSGVGALVLELSVAHATPELSGDAVRFTAPGGRVLDYGSLRVNDAERHLLPARFELSEPGRLRLVVEDAAVIYPLTIDPLITAGADAQLAGGQLGARLGTSIAGAGDVNRDGFDDVIVGVPGFDAGETDEGAAFVFHGSADGLVTSPAAMIQSNQAGAALGCSVAMGDVNRDDFSDVVVGADHFDSGEIDEGAAFVFHGSSSGIVASGYPGNAAAYLESNQAGAAFAYRVAMVNTAVASGHGQDGYADVMVGAPSYDAGQEDEGAAFVFAGGDSGIVAYGHPGNAAIRVESNQVGAQLGASVAPKVTKGEYPAGMLVGAPWYDAGETDEGAVFVIMCMVYLGDPPCPTSLTPSDAVATFQADQAGARAGTSAVGLASMSHHMHSPQVVLVGAPGYDAGELDEGAVFLFGPDSGDDWPVSDRDPTNSERFEANQAGAAFGTSLDMGDVNGDGLDDMIIGAPLYDGGETDEGAVFVAFSSVLPMTRLESNQAGAQLGWSVASVGDVDGDGYHDVMGGAPLYDGTESDEGAAWLHLGGGLGVPTPEGDAETMVLRARTLEWSLGNGYGVSAAGDVNGDGYSDVIIGTPHLSNGQFEEGAAFVFHGRQPQPPFGDRAWEPASVIQSNQAGAHLGWSVARAGDVNSDGFDDVIVGAPDYDAGQQDEGVAFVFHGSPSGIVANGSPIDADALFESNQAVAHLGWSVGGAGDVNGDAHGDVIVGAPDYDAGQEDEGAAFVFHGSASGLVANGTPANARSRFESNAENGRLGAAVAGAGDVDADGYADVVVGAPGYEAGGLTDGVALVFHGGPAGLIAFGSPANARSRLRSLQPSSGMGTSVDAAGDVNGDGYADVIAGAPRYASGEEFEGAAFVFHGSASGIIGDGDPSSANARLESDQEFAELGTNVSSAGDVDGDGFADVVAAAPYGGATSYGIAYVFHGSESGIHPSGSPATADAAIPSIRYTAFDVAGVGDLDGDGFADLASVSPDREDNVVYFGNGGYFGRRVTAQALRTPTLEGIPAWGSAANLDGFTVRLGISGPFGYRRAKLEIEACAAGVPFGHPSCLRSESPNWSQQTTDQTMTASIAGLPSGALYRWRARPLFRPLDSAPPADAPPLWRGPWRRYGAQVVEADLRIALDTDGDGIMNEIDTDDDGDGLLDIHETDTGVYVSPTDTGSDPLDADSDDDGYPDGDEVAAGTDPNDAGSPPISSVPSLGTRGRGLLVLLLALASRSTRWRRGSANPLFSRSKV